MRWPAPLRVMKGRNENFAASPSSNSALTASATRSFSWTAIPDRSTGFFFWAIAGAVRLASKRKASARRNNLIIVTDSRVVSLIRRSRRQPFSGLSGTMFVTAM